MSDITRKRSVGKRCVAYGCSNKYGDGVALHLFPMDRPDLCKQWTTFVKKKRDKWEGPTKYSAICQKHFGDGSYPMKYAILQSLGRTPPKKKVLNTDAVPTIQTENAMTAAVTPEQETEDPVDMGLTPLFTSTPAKRPRSAFMKREKRRLINEIMDDQNQTVVHHEAMETDQEDTFPTIIETPSTMNISSAATRTCGTQLSMRKPSSRAVRIQVTPLTKEKGCQTSRHQPKMKSVEIQCNILKVPVKEKLNSSAISSDPDLNHSWFSSDQIDHDDSVYQLSDSESDSDCLIEDRAQEEERMFLVSETSLMTLFRFCPLCSSVLVVCRWDRFILFVTPHFWLKLILSYPVRIFYLEIRRGISHIEIAVRVRERIASLATAFTVGIHLVVFT